MLMTYLPRFNREIDQLFDEALRSVTGTVTWAPACDAYEDEQGFWVEAAVPGMEPGEIELEVEDGVLTLRGERKAPSKEGVTRYVSELTEGKFSRSLTLPTSVDQHKASASYRNGILTVQFPKAEEAKPRRIVIEAK